MGDQRPWISWVVEFTSSWPHEHVFICYLIFIYIIHTLATKLCPLERVIFWLSMNIVDPPKRFFLIHPER